MAARYRPGPHELGQNFLVDPRTITAVVRLAAQGRRPLVEWAAGNGAVTEQLATLGLPLEAVELDPRQVQHLRRRLGPHVTVTQGDILRHAPPRHRHDLVCNVPFGITTPVLRRLLTLQHWQRAILITQWEVARKRAGVGGATQLTAQWWPWFEFSVRQRVPSAAFRPRPSVDAGLLLIERRPAPLLGRRLPDDQALDDRALDDRARYQRWVRDVFNGRGSGLRQILARAGGAPPERVDAWCARQGLTERTLPRDLTAQQWVDGYRATAIGQPGPGAASRR